MAAFLGCILLLADLRKRKRAMSRMKVATGVVRTMKTHQLGYNRVRQQRSRTEVDVEFSVNGQTYRCVDLYLFGDNGHITDVGTKFDFPPGQQVGVYYDPENPKLNALVFNAPSSLLVWIVAGIGAVFMIIAALAEMR